jgi:uncharacterized membrane protein YkoI
MKSSRTLSWAIAVLATLLAIAPLAAEDDADHERAGEAVRRGELLSLEQILALHPLQPGERLVEVELDRDDGRWEYELQILTPTGRVRELEIDGASGALLDEDSD